MSFIVLLGFVGLSIDLGRIFVAMGSLRRAVDAASLGAASQFREGRGIEQMTAMAAQIMNMNGVTPDSVLVEDCPHALVANDPVLCVTPRHKLVRVTASVAVPMAFLRVININSFSISSNAVSEAASLDVVLVIDVSESMSSDNTGNGRDPGRCNDTQTCQPFEKVRGAANAFVDRVLDLEDEQESDRIAIVYFSNGWQSGATAVVSPGWITDAETAHARVNTLSVYEPPDCDTHPAIGTCISHDASGGFLGINCPVYETSSPNDPSSCTTTNIGGALRLAGNMFATESRPEALWVVILLTDGAANASDRNAGHPYGFCPDSTWNPPFCRDSRSSTRHDGASQPLLYDADDYARDNADFVGCYQNDTAPGCSTPGQGALIFTIGLGNQVLTTYASGDVAHGVALLRYIAAVGDDGDPDTDFCAGLNGDINGWRQHCGNYYFDATGDRLISVFEDIASRIFTRITR